MGACCLVRSQRCRGRWRGPAPGWRRSSCLLSGELRQGALEGVMTEAVAGAADVPVAEVRRAMMLRGSLGVVAAAALSGGSEALGAFGLEVGRPVRPMLAASAPTLADALD